MAADPPLPHSLAWELSIKRLGELMLKLRAAAAATVIALLAAFASAGSANAQVPGKGTTETATSLVEVALGNAGSLLNLRILGDDAKATIDSAVGPTSAFSQLFALKATSSVLPALNNITIPSPPLESRTPGGNGNVTGPVINLANALPALPVLGTTIASGSIAPVSLTSAIENGVAKSGLGANLADIGLVADLISVEAIKSTMGAAAGSASADGFRGLDVGALSVLNLGALLRGLGIDPSLLAVPDVSSLIENLNVPVAGLPTGTTLDSLVTTLTDTINTLEGLAGSDTFGGLTAPLQGTLGGLGLPVGAGGTIPDATTVTTLLTEATDLLEGVLETALGVLDSVELLKLNGLKIGTVTKAVTSTGDSKADVVGTLGSVAVGNLPLINGLDLGAAVGTVTGLVDTVTGTLDGVLAPLGLDGIVDLALFEKASNNGVSQSGGYTRALAGITGLRLSINPPADIANIVNGLTSGTGIGSLITNEGGTVPVVGGLMDSLNGVAGIPDVGGVVGALLGGASLKVASVATGSNFTAQVAGATPVTQLPRTGADTTAFFVIGMLMVGGVIVGRRYIPIGTEK